MSERITAVKPLSPVYEMTAFISGLWSIRRLDFLGLVCQLEAAAATTMPGV